MGHGHGKVTMADTEPATHAEDCAPLRVLALFGSKWTSMVLHVLHTLHDGTCRTAAFPASARRC